MTEPCLYLVIGENAAEVTAWMEGYIRHWATHEIVCETQPLLIVDMTQNVAYHGIDGSQRDWRRSIQHARPETVILLRGWTDVKGIGMELDLLKAVGAKVIFAEPFGVLR